MDANLIGKIQKKIRKKVIGTSKILGGCISSAFKLEIEDEAILFCKTNSIKSKMFLCEHVGLEELSKFNLKVPKVICSDDQFILTEYINHGLKDHETFYNLGKSLSLMHSVRGEKFGFKEDNFIGANPQKNKETSSWIDFYFENRLKFQYQLAESKKILKKEIVEGFVRLERKFHRIINENNVPTLLHGDLWSGNVLVNTDSRPVLIEPAVYYGYR